MKRFVIISTLLYFMSLLFVGCDYSRNIKVANSNEGLDDKNDSVEEEETTDELKLFVESPLPKAADDLFDDFFFNFISNPQFQSSRVVFPLKIKGDEETKSLNLSQWKEHNVFVALDFYTTIYERDDELEIMKDTSLHTVNVEWIYLREQRVEKYEFCKIEGLWKLCSLEKQSMQNIPNSNFLDFYSRFSSDSTFQREHLSDPVQMNMSENGESIVMDIDSEYDTENDDDDVEELEDDSADKLSADDWFEFVKEMPFPRDILVNIEYGQSYFSENVKHILVQGISNGMFVRYTFQKHGEWRLVEVEI